MRGEELPEAFVGFGGLDKRRFRANVYINMASGHGFGEDAFVGRTVLIGGKT